MSRSVVGDFNGGNCHSLPPYPPPSGPSYLL